PWGVVELLSGSEFSFRARAGRLFSDGLRIGFPDVSPALVVTSHGSIGLDETLDLHLDLPRLDRIKRTQKQPARCHVTGTIHNPKVAIRDASLVIRVPQRKEPIIDVDGVNLDAQVKHVESGLVLVVEPVKVFEKQKLTGGLASELARLIAPDLAGPKVTGEMALSLSRVHIPLGGSRDDLLEHAEVEGKLSLHKVAAEAKSPLGQA